MPVTIKDIAQQLGISSATVSMALNNRPGVNPETRRRVLEQVERMNYTGGVARRELKSKGTLSFLVYKRHGRVVADTHFFAELIESVECAARREGYQVGLVYCQGIEQAYDTLGQIRAAAPDGLLILGTEMLPDDLPPLRALGLPMVLLDCDLPDCGADRVVISNAQGVARGVRYLYERGFREIGYLRSALPIRNFEQRAQGYRSALSALGLAEREERVFFLRPSAEEAYEDMCAAIEKGRRVPPACVADNDVIASGALKAFKKYGLRIPGQVSVIGFDDEPVCTWTDPELTTERVYRRELGRLAVTRLAERIQSPDSPFLKIAVDTVLVERGSVGGVD